MKKTTVKEIRKWLKTLEEFRYRKVRGVDARRIASFVNNGVNETELPNSLIKKWQHAKYGREKHLANKFVSQKLNTESVNEDILINEMEKSFTQEVMENVPGEEISTENIDDKSNDLKEFGVDSDAPDLFNSETENSNPEELLSSDNEEDDDLEIPAFLRRQKN